MYLCLQTVVTDWVACFIAACWGPCVHVPQYKGKTPHITGTAAFLAKMKHSEMAHGYC